MTWAVAQCKNTSLEWAGSWVLSPLELKKGKERSCI